MKFALALAAALIATPAAAQSVVVKPTALLFNGLAQYQPGILTPLAALASDLRQQGWRVVIDNHLGIFSRNEEPVLIVGHSAGGARAYMFGKKMVEEAKFHPLIITLDAATVWGDVYRCPVENCINIHTLPVSLRFSRRNCTSKVRSSTSALVCLPFTVIVTDAMRSSRA